MATDLMGQILAQQILRRGQRPSPQSLLAQRLMQQATDTSPTTGIGALARTLTGAFGGMATRQAEEDETAREEAAFGRFQGHMNQQRDEASAFGARLRGAPPPAPAMPQMPQGMPQMPQGMPSQAAPAAPAAPGAGPAGGSDPLARHRHFSALRRQVLDDPNLTPEQQQQALARISAEHAAAGGTREIPGGYRGDQPWAAGLARPSGVVPTTAPPMGGQPPTQSPPPTPTQSPAPPPTQAAPQFDMAALQEGLTHPNPLVREQALAAVQMLQLQRQQQRPPISVAPGSTLLDPNTHQPVYTAPQQPDSAERMLGRWRELSARGEQATPAEAQERDMLGARLRGSGTNITVGGAPQVGTIPPGYQITREGDSYRMEPIPGGPAARTLATEQGNALRSAEETVALIDGVLGHRALTLGTGLTGQLANAIPGTPTYDFGQRVAQLQGRAFLQAFESLKGGGQITEVEGRKATEAIARLSTAQSAEDFRTSLGELRAIVEQARIRAGGRPPEPQATVPGPNGGAAEPPPAGGSPRVIEFDAQGRRVTR